MSGTITKKDLGDMAETIIEAVDYRLQKMENRMDEKYAKEKTLRDLTITLDNFLKQLSDYKEEFTLLKGEVDQIKRIIKAKLGVEVAIQNAPF